MKKKPFYKNNWFWILTAIILILLYPMDYTNEKVNPEKDFLNIYQAPDSIAQMVKTACYDCHSNQTVYPWYSKIPPVSWYIKSHVNGGREFVNFSKWGDYNKYQQEYILKSLPDEVKYYKMPLPSYLSKHPKANLNAQQRKQLIKWFKTI